MKSIELLVITTAVVLILPVCVSLVVKLNTAGGPSPAEFLALMCTVYEVFGLRDTRVSELIPLFGTNLCSDPLKEVTI
jgi:hypothetical protein